MFNSLSGARSRKQRGAAERTVISVAHLNFMPELPEVETIVRGQPSPGEGRCDRFGLAGGKADDLKGIRSCTRATSGSVDRASRNDRPHPIVRTTTCDHDASKPVAGGRRPAQNIDSSA
jgi:hypothetical protein